MRPNPRVERSGTRDLRRRS